MAENLQKKQMSTVFFLLDFEDRAALDCHLELLIRMVMTPVPLIIKSIITRFVFPSPGTFSFEFLFVRSGPEWRYDLYGVECVYNYGRPLIIIDPNKINIQMTHQHYQHVNSNIYI